MLQPLFRLLVRLMVLLGWVLPSVLVFSYTGFTFSLCAVQGSAHERTMRRVKAALGVRILAPLSSRRPRASPRSLRALRRPEVGRRRPLCPSWGSRRPTWRPRIIPLALLYVTPAVYAHAFSLLIDMQTSTS